MDLKCKKLDCKFNCKFACMQKEIMVSSASDCKTFEKAEKLEPDQLQNVPETMFEKAPKLHAFRHSKKVEIKCAANCLFNDGGYCVANGITLDGIRKKAGCLTYIIK